MIRFKNIRLAAMPVLCCMLLAGPALAGDGFRANCKAKEQAIERELEYARQHRNEHRIRGLETALEKVRAWCTDDNLAARAELKVMDKADKVRERERDLEEAKAKGKPDKIAKREQKLAEAKEELRQAEQELKAIQPGT